MLKKILVVTAIMSLTASSALAAEKTMEWKLSTIRPSGTSVDKDAKAFAEKVKEKTNGRINITVYPNSQLGDYQVVQERISVGSVEMAIQPISTTVDKQMQLLNMPYLVKDWDSLKKNYLTGTPFMNWAAGRFDRQDIKLLATWPVYFGGTALTKEPPSPGDPSVPKNLKARVIPQKSFELLATSHGYLATPLPFAETFTALQTGIVEGAFGAGAEGYYSNFRDVLKFYVPSNTHVEQWYVILNKEIWESLSDADKAAVEEAAKEMETNRIAKAPEETKEFEKKLDEYGVKVLPLTPEELGKLAEAARKLIFPEIRNAIGEKEFDEAIKNVVE
ncbi:TRAP transporter substrate-binding protein DctP [Desulfovibrio sp. OttesenSCG-928-G15]|nr:TRAP transporter substrate-binding protein DctP [Desulfovibrio sp. OttesenSCG-928-G15]